MAAEPARGAAPEIAEQLLATKLLVPRLGPEVVHRPRLVERLENATRRRLTIVAAPAGFGKTTAVAAWIAAKGPRVAWLGLDDADNTFERFLLHLVEALRSGWPGVGGSALAGLARMPLRPAVMLAALVNDLAGQTQPLTLVCDDFEVLTNPEVLEACAFLLEHQPPELHVVLLTRAEPRLPLPRWRARGQVEELTLDDLRFTAEEASSFLNEAMALQLSPLSLATLHNRTEGWIAGLQLAAVSLARAPAREHLVAAFAGDHRYVADFLVEEVLRRQEPEVEDFLLKTSILQRLSGELCDAVTDTLGSDALLERLAEANLFVLRLDEQRRWYRYHALFAELLRHRLAARHPDAETELHRRASGWFAAHGLPAEAIQHALGARDRTLAAQVLEQNARPMLVAGRPRELAGWLARLPEEELATRPRLGLLAAFAHLGERRLEASAHHLAAVERCLAALAEPPPDLVGGLRLSQAGLALFKGEITLAIERGRQALDIMGPARARGDGAIESVLALAHFARGELAGSRELAEQGLARGLASGHSRAALLMLSLLARLDFEGGELNAAEASARRGLALAAERGWWEHGFRAALELTLAEALYAKNNLEETGRVLASAGELATRLGPDEFEDLATVAAARLRQTERAEREAPPLSPERSARSEHHDRLFASAAFEVLRLRLLAGEAAEVAAELRRRGGDPETTDLQPEREREDLLLCQALIAGGHPTRALPLLARLLLAAEQGGRRRAEIEALGLAAVARHLLGQTALAKETLLRALERTGGEPWLRLFLDLGAPLKALLPRVVEAGGEIALRLLDAFGQAPSSPGAVAPLAEPIRERELDVLRAIVAGASNQEIAERLYLSPNTVKTHVRNLYAKLGVETRSQAIRRAHELGLVAGAGGRITP